MRSLAGARVSELRGSEVDERLLEELMAPPSSIESASGRGRLLRGDGQIRAVEWRMDPITDGARTIQRVATQRALVKFDAWQIEISQLSNALNLVDAAVVVFSGENMVHYRNHAAHRLFPGKIALPQEAWARLAAGDRWMGSLQIVASNESRHFVARVQPVPVDGVSRQRYLMTARDATEEERLRVIANSVNLSESIGHFLLGIRHELGNPVNSIKTALMVLRANMTRFSAEKVNDYIDRILAEVDRVEYLLRDLRTFTAHETLSLEEHDVETLLRRVAHLTAPDMEHAGIEFRQALTVTALVRVDGRAFYQVIINLLSNASDAVAGSERKVVSLEARLVGDQVEISVADSGTGIPDSVLKQLARPFYTTKRQGSGLGLAIVNRLLNKMEGTFRVEAAPGGGTRTIVTFVNYARGVLTG